MKLICSQAHTHTNIQAICRDALYRSHSKHRNVKKHLEKYKRWISFELTWHRFCRTTFLRKNEKFRKVCRCPFNVLHTRLSLTQCKLLQMFKKRQKETKNPMCGDRQKFYDVLLGTFYMSVDFFHAPTKLIGFIADEICHEVVSSDWLDTLGIHIHKERLKHNL